MELETTINNISKEQSLTVKEANTDIDEKCHYQ